MLSSGIKCFHLELMLSSGTKCYHLELTFSSGANVIIWDEMLSSGANVIIWVAMLSSGANVFIWDKMLSSRAYVIMVSSAANVIIWCYHVMLSSGMITHPFLFFLKTSLTQTNYNNHTKKLTDMQDRFFFACTKSLAYNFVFETICFSAWPAVLGGRKT